MAVPQLISIEEAADRLGIHTATVRRMIKRGELKAYRLGHRIIRVEEADITHYLQKVVMS
jgi:excisionase family DNA binding protein